MIFGIAAAIIVAGGVYLVYSRWSGNPLRDSRVLDWIRNPRSHPDWAVQIGQRCSNAPFQLPTQGYIGYLWDDSSGPVTATRASISSAGTRLDS